MQKFKKVKGKEKTPEFIEVQPNEMTYSSPQYLILRVSNNLYKYLVG